MRYSTVAALGKKLNTTNKIKMIEGIAMELQVINLTNTKKIIVCVTTDVADIVNVCPFTLVIKSTSRYTKGNINQSCHSGYGKVSLFLGIVPAGKNVYHMSLDQELATILKKTKDNVTKKGAANHHNSTGRHYSFGNKGAYKCIGSSSVGQYPNKKLKVKNIGGGSNTC